MSKFMRKSEDFLTGDHHDSIRSSNCGPHELKIAKKADPHVNSNSDSRPRHEGGTCTPGDTNIANKLEPRVDSEEGAPDYYHLGSAKHYGHGGTASTIPRIPNTTNNLDTLVVSEVDNRAGHGALAGSSYTNSACVATPGSHSPNVANKFNNSDNWNAGTDSKPF